MLRAISFSLTLCRSELTKARESFSVELIDGNISEWKVPLQREKHVGFRIALLRWSFL